MSQSGLYRLPCVFELFAKLNSIIAWQASFESIRLRQANFLQIALIISSILVARALSETLKQASIEILGYTLPNVCQT